MLMTLGKKRLSILASSVALLLVSTRTRAQADSATWLGGSSSVWSDSTNWTGNFPNSTTDVATFDSNATSFTPTISGTDSAPAITLDQITIGATAAQAFTFTVTGTSAQPASLTFSGDGVLNSSSFAQQFVITGDGTTPTSTTASAGITLNNGSSAGTNTSWTLNTGGAVYFNNSSSAGTGTTWTVDSTSAVYFSGTASSVSAAFVNSGTFDISQQTGGVTVGSIAGSGNFYLGSNTLTTGADDTSTTVSGVIQDGGVGGGTGGVLTKIGAGTLTLTGANTYTGGTNLTNGELLFDDSNTPSSALGGAAGGALTITNTTGGTTTLGSDVSGQELPNYVNVKGDFAIYNPSGDFYFQGTVDLNDQTHTITGLTAEGQVHFSGQIISSSAGTGGISFVGGAGGLHSVHLRRHDG